MAVPPRRSIASPSPSVADERSKEDAMTWDGWSEVPGGGTTDRALCAITADTEYLFAKGIRDNRIYVNSRGAQGAWGGWSEVPGGGTTDRALASAYGSIGVLLFAKGIQDQKLYFNLLDGQLVAGRPATWHGWREVPGGGTTDAAPNAVEAGASTYLFAKGIQDRRIYFNRAPAGTTNFVGWAEVPGGATTDTSVGSAYSGSGLHLFAKGINDRRIYVNRMDVNNGQWSGWSSGRRDDRRGSECRGGPEPRIPLR
jgi:hypothetical protein